jgi:multidrug transporter EmrE-like cation transporter
MTNLSLVTFVLLMMSVGIPGIAVTIAYAAWRGKPKTFDREMYWTSFATAGIASVLVFVLAQKLNSNGLAGHILPVLCLLLALLLFGVSMGCGIAIFAWRRPDSPANESNVDSQAQDLPKETPLP